MAEHMRADTDTLSLDEYLRLPEDGRAELVRGRVAREPQPGFEHGRIQTRLAALLMRHIEDVGLDLVCVGPVGFVLERDPPTVRSPDLALVRSSGIPSAGPEAMLEGAPELAVEIVSPSNTAAEIQEKVRDYLSGGARLVWVVYPRSRTVAVHQSTSRARTLAAGEVLEEGGLLPGLRLDVAEVFAD